VAPLSELEAAWHLVFARQSRWLRQVA